VKIVYEERGGLGREAVDQLWGVDKFKKAQSKSGYNEGLVTKRCHWS